MANQLLKGANAALSGTDLTVDVRFDANGVGIDAAALLLTADGRVRNDDDFVFFNAPVAADGAVRLADAGAGRQQLHVRLGQLPSDIEKVAVTASVDAAAPGRSFSDIRGLAVEVDGQEFVPPPLTVETAVVLIELYRRAGQWKVRAVGQGYDTGLAGIARDFGISVDDEPAAPPTPPAPQVQSSTSGPPMTLPGEERLPVNMRKALDLRKQKVQVVLEKKGLVGVRARVQLVIDASGSMTQLFRDGTVARVVERLIPVAARLDDDGSMETWSFASNPLPLPGLTVATMAQWLDRNLKQGALLLRVPKLRGPNFNSLGIGNDEPKVMALVLQSLDQSDSLDPTLVLFLSDGGIYKNDEIGRILVESSRRPLFWQFVGIGRSNYGVLEQLDTLPGRAVDNAGFFAVDDIERITDDELYERLLSEFPRWIAAAKTAGILR